MVGICYAQGVANITILPPIGLLFTSVYHYEQLSIDVTVLIWEDEEKKKNLWIVIQRSKCHIMILIK